MVNEHCHETDCDKCGKQVKSGKLIPVPFLYLDKNDWKHADLGGGYRAYAVCEVCWKKGV
jgi:hypothetical protein